MHASDLATGGSPIKNITAIDTDYPDFITAGCVWLDRGHRRSVQRLIDYAVSALRRGEVLSALCDVPYQRVRENVFYPCTGLPCLPCSTMFTMFSKCLYVFY
jgi:hypothetical protein